jgi:RHS repeat-associated protein
VDVFGNEVTYTYEEVVAGECRLKYIEWGANGPASLSNFARVELVWATTVAACGGVPVGSQSDYRSGIKVVTGGSQLDVIRVTAFPPGQPTAPEHTREITLSYWSQQMQCDQPHAPVRLLSSIQESAWIAGAPHVNLPAVTLDYGDPTVLFDYPGQAENRPWGATSNLYNNLGWGYRYAAPNTDPIDRTPTVEVMFVDMDGDGLVDRLVNTSQETVDGVCKAAWQKNMGPPAGSTEPVFGAAKEVTLPRLKWHGLPFGQDPPPPEGSPTASAARGEKCSLAGQVTSFWNSVAGGGCHDGIPGSPTACHPAIDPNDETLYCDPGGRECPAGGTPDPRTYLYYRWLDADGDGMTDLVAAVHGDIQTYDIEQGNSPSNAPPPPEPLLFGPWPACPTDTERCRDVIPDCITGAHGDLAAINTCIVNAATMPCSKLISGTLGSANSTPRGAYTRCEGLYPWFIFKNLGDGTFDNPIIKYQPVPLESNMGDSSLGQLSGVIAERHAVVDFDGDGILDAVAQPNLAGQFLWVWFGDGTGGFEPKRYFFLGRPNELLSASSFSPLVSVSTPEGLIDLNSDGMLDHFREITGPENASIWFNTGTEHASNTEIFTPYLQSTYSVKPGDDTNHVITVYRHSAPNPPAQPNDQWIYYAGSTYAQNRIFDVDNDGRPDAVQDIGSGRPRVFFNVGGEFNAPWITYPSPNGSINVQGLRRQTVINGQLDVVEGTWELQSDHIDLDGDGIPESVDFSSGSYTRARQTNTEPPRLLTKVHNGRGAHATITYASMHDKTTVAQCTDPLSCQFWTDHWGHQHPNASPHNQWVAKSTTTTDDFSNTTATTSYFYENPRHGPDDKGRYAFRGFGQVTTTTPSGAKTVERYGYDVDWSGRLVESLIMPSAAESSVQGEVRSITKTTWEERALFNATVQTHHATVVENYTCANETDETGCKAAPAGYLRTTTTLDELVPTGGSEPLLWHPRSSLVHAGGVADTAPDRQTTTTELVFRSDADFYRLRPLTTEKRVDNAGTMELYAKNAAEWDADLRVKLSETVWFDNNTSAVTHYDYDMVTGNLKKRWKPEQFATNKFTEYTYDSRQLFIGTEVNELGHQFDYTYEYGTGTKLMTAGPNQRTCTTSPDCPLDATHPLKEQHKVVVDGFGRTIESWDTVSDDGALYELMQRSTTSFVDTPVGTTPTSVSNRVRLSAASATWIQEDTQLDGHGRPIQRTKVAQPSAPADEVTVYTYRDDGTLATVEVPDPTQNSAARVTYSYTFDSLRRPTSIRRPDANQSGVNMAYQGIFVITMEWLPVGSGGGDAAGSIAVHDSFGRVVQVQEVTDWSPPEPTVAVTSYTYGPDDNVISVVDPDGVTTTMEHDFAGHRTQIARYGRLWKYTYDLNGNLETVQVPGSPNPPVTDINYTTSIQYDDLDRPNEKVIGQRSLSSPDQQLFADGTEHFEWDTGGNGIGLLAHWDTAAPGASIPAVQQETAYNNQAQPITATDSLDIAELPSLQRQFGRRYHLFGGVSETHFMDQLGGLNETTATIDYDLRGLPVDMVLKRTGQADEILANDTRNVAGLVTQRTSSNGTRTVEADSFWTYDALGRVTNQLVQKVVRCGRGCLQTTHVVQQAITYFANDNPATLTHYLGTNSQLFNFTYDTRHQLKTASSTTAGYFDAAYDYGDGGRMTHINEAQTINPLPPGTQVKPRDVNYVYGDPDPERVTALTNVSDGTTYVGYSYDESGNMTQRCTGGSGIPTCAGESFEFVYDGNDQLRRATKKLAGIVQGSEEYWYGNGGQRVAIVKRDAAGNKTEVIWFIGDVEAHYDGSGNATHTYSHLSLGTPVARVDRTSDTSTAVEYQFHGLASSTIATIAQTGTTNTSFSYAPFGEILESTDAGGSTDGIAAHQRRLNDKYEDDLTSLAYYGARYYDKTLIGWTQSDPLYRLAPDLAKSTPRRANLYQFSLSNPLRYIDPDGRDSGLDTGGHWSRAGEATVFFAMKHEQKGQLYGGGWIEGPLPAAEDTPNRIDCGAQAPGMCEAVVNGDVQLTFGEKLAIAFPGAPITYASWDNPGGLFNGIVVDPKNGTAHMEEPGTLAKVAGWVGLSAGAAAVALDLIGGWALAGGAGAIAADKLPNCGSSGGAAPAVAVKAFGGTGQQIGIVKLGAGGVGIATAAREAGGMSHVDLARKAFGALAVGERRLGYTVVGNHVVFQKLSTGTIPEPGDFAGIRQALSAAGVKGDPVVLRDGQMVPIK